MSASAVCIGLKFTGGGTKTKLRPRTRGLFAQLPMQFTAHGYHVGSLTPHWLVGALDYVTEGRFPSDP